MNPEIRFRVSPEIHSLAEQRAEELGLSGAGAGRSAGVPLLARAALYQWLGLPWPEDLPRPLSVPMSPHPSRAQLSVHHSWSDNYRRQVLFETGQALAETAVTQLELEPQGLSRRLKQCLRLEPSGGLRGTLYVPELQCDGPLQVEELDAFLQSQAALPDPRQWEHSLASWSQEHGSELLRARLEEGFAWLNLAESEWMVWRIQEAAGSCGAEPLRAEQSLAGQDWVHSVYPDREPALERIQLLRQMRSRCADLGGLRLTLVRGTRDRIESRRRTAGAPFLALLWQLYTPAGQSLGVLTHHQPE